MLKVLRKKTKLIVWTVVISFALWGGYSVGTSFRKEGRIAGEVFGKSVSFQEFESFHRAAQIFSFSGKPLEDPDEVKHQAWQTIMFSREAKQRKIEVTDDEVRDEVKRLLAAQKIENLTPEIYRQWLSATVRESPKVFEEQVREILRIRKLIREINEAPIESPREEEARQKFLLESQELEAERISFAAEEEAKKFREKVKDAKAWKKEIEKAKLSPVLDPSKPLGELITLWKISEFDIVKLYELKPQEISQPVPAGGQFFLFRLVGKKAADEKKFEGELKEKYLKEITEQKKSMRFLTWSLSLLDKAQLKDYLPRAETAPNA